MKWHAKLRAEQAAKDLKIFNTRRIVLGEGGSRLVTPSTKPKAGLGAWLTKKISGEAHMEYPLELHYQGKVHKFSVVRVCARGLVCLTYNWGSRALVR